MIKIQVARLATLLCAFAAVQFGFGKSSEPVMTQPVLGHRSAPLLSVDGLSFKDLDRNGKLDPYEDWRLPAQTRATDLVQHMSLEELAGLMVHGTLPSFGPLAVVGTGNSYDLDKSRELILNRGVSSFITRLSGDAKTLASQNNQIQELAESSPFGIPVIISTIHVTIFKIFLAPAP